MILLTEVEQVLHQISISQLFWVNKRIKIQEAQHHASIGFLF